MKVGIITKTSINSLPISPASGSKTFVWEAGLPGFGAYRSGTKRISFIYQYKNGSGSTRSKLIGYLGELTIEQARSIASDYAHQRRRGIDPLAEMQRLADEEKRRTELLLSFYAEGYIARRIASRKPLNDAQTRIVRNDVVRLLGDVRIDRMTVEDVEGFAATLAERGPSARRMGLTAEGWAVLHMLMATRPQPVRQDRPGRATVRQLTEVGLGPEEREARLGRVERMALDWGEGFRRKRIGAWPHVILVERGEGPVPVLQTTWSLRFDTDEQRDDFYEWLCVRLDRWPAWAKLADGHPHLELTQHLLMLMGAALAGDADERIIANV